MGGQALDLYHFEAEAFLKRGWAHPPCGRARPRSGGQRPLGAGRRFSKGPPPAEGGRRAHEIPPTRIQKPFASDWHFAICNQKPSERRERF